MELVLVVVVGLKKIASNLEKCLKLKSEETAALVSKVADFKARVHSPDKTQLRQDLETTPTGVDFTPDTSRINFDTLRFYIDKTRFSPESTAMQQTVTL